MTKLKKVEHTHSITAAIRKWNDFASFCNRKSSLLCHCGVPFAKSLYRTHLTLKNCIPI